MYFVEIPELDDAAVTKPVAKVDFQGLLSVVPEIVITFARTDI